MTQRRLRQANLFGPAGFVSADDGEVIELSQQGFEQKPFHRTLAELGGREVGDTDHMVTETLIRGMYALLAQGDGGDVTHATSTTTSQLTQLYADYAARRRLRATGTLWPEFFTDDCSLPAAAAREPRARLSAGDAVVREQGHAEGPRLRHHARRCSTTRTTSATWSARRVLRKRRRRAHRVRGQLRGVPHQAVRADRRCSTSAATSTSSCARPRA